MAFISNLNWRYATKQFNIKVIETGLIKKILSAIRLSPSSFGIQPYHITIIKNQSLKKKLKPHAWNQEQVTTCSHLLVFSADLNADKRINDYLKLAARAKRYDITNDPNYDYKKGFKEFIEATKPEWSAKQLYIALGFAIAACAELKVDSCPMEGFEPKEFKKILKLPKNLEPKVLLAIGYRNSDDKNSKFKKIRFSDNELFDLK